MSDNLFVNNNLSVIDCVRLELFQVTYFFSATDLNLAFIKGVPLFHSGSSSELAMLLVRLYNSSICCAVAR